MTIKYHAVMSFMGIDEFGVDLEAATRQEAEEYLREQYPESSIAQLETAEETAAREKRIYDAALLEEADWELDDEFLDEDVEIETSDEDLDTYLAEEGY